jgi:hypothetical protein
LRQALEEGEMERKNISQKIRAQYEGEKAQLEGTIVALRECLEQARHDSQTAVVGAVGNSA